MVEWDTSMAVATPLVRTKRHTRGPDSVVEIKLPEPIVTGVTAAAAVVDVRRVIATVGYAGCQRTRCCP